MYTACTDYDFWPLRRIGCLQTHLSAIWGKIQHVSLKRTNLKILKMSPKRWQFYLSLGSKSTNVPLFWLASLANWKHDYQDLWEYFHRKKYEGKNNSYRWKKQGNQMILFSYRNAKKNIGILAILQLVIAKIFVCFIADLYSKLNWSKFQGPP